MKPGEHRRPSGPRSEGERGEAEHNQDRLAEHDRAGEECDPGRDEATGSDLDRKRGDRRPRQEERRESVGTAHRQVPPEKVGGLLPGKIGIVDV